MTADRPTTEPRTEAGRALARSIPKWVFHGVFDSRVIDDAILAIEAEAAQGAAPRAEGLDGASKGIRCSATHDVAGWCSRDEGHPGAHESRDPSGPGLGAWWNERYSRSRPSDERVIHHYCSEHNHQRTDIPCPDASHRRVPESEER